MNKQFLKVKKMEKNEKNHNYIITNIKKKKKHGIITITSQEHGVFIWRHTVAYYTMN